MRLVLLTLALTATLAHASPTHQCSLYVNCTEAEIAQARQCPDVPACPAPPACPACPVVTCPVPPPLTLDVVRSIPGIQVRVFKRGKHRFVIKGTFAN